MTQVTKGNTKLALTEVRTSYDLFTVLNHFRVEAGEKPYRKHADLVVKIKKECDDFEGHETVTFGRINNLGKEVLDLHYPLTREQVFLTSMRESKQVRKAVYQYITKLEDDNRKLQSVVYQVIKGQKYIAQEQALKCAGITHPRKFMKILKENELWLNNVMEQGYLEYKTVNSHKDKAWKFSQKGFEWLVDNCDKANSLVDKGVK